MAHKKEVEELAVLLDRLPADKLRLAREILQAFSKTSDAHDDGFPASIFSTELTPFESICTFLVEQRSMKYKDIAQLVHRDTAIVGITYRRARKKHPTALPVHSEVIVPFDIFSERMTLFESIVLHLTKTHTVAQIAALLNRKYRTIWTGYSRARKK